MAHEVETMAYAFKEGSNQASYQVPWHGLGVPVSNTMTPHEMMVAAKLNWEVVRKPTYYDTKDRQRIPSGREVLLRSTDDEFLTHITPGWHENQNSVAFDLFTEWVKEGNMEMNSAGSLKDGKIVWALAKCNKSFGLFNKQDEIDLYMLFTNPHMYGKAIDIRATPIRVVCNNTLSYALNENSDVQMKLHHNKKFDVDFVKQTLGQATQVMEKYQEKAEFLSRKPFKMDDLIQYYNQLFPSQSRDQVKKAQPVRNFSDLSRVGQQVYSYLNDQPGAKFGKGYWWQAYNSVTYALDHKVGKSTDRRLTSAWYGQSHLKKIKALDLAVVYANAS